MEAYVLDEDGLKILLAKIAKKWDIYGPKKAKQGNVFSKISRVEDLELDYDTTILPAKKFFLPPRETIFSFSKENDSTKVEEEITEGKIALLGIKPCEVNSILILDEVMGRDLKDPYYLNRRAGGLIVAINCTKAYDECRCVEFDTGPELKSGYDLLLTDLGGPFLIEIGSDEGAKILEELKLRKATDEDTTKKTDRINAVREKLLKKAVGIEELKKLVVKENTVWKKIANDCLYCGNCSLVCPTCFCYTVTDTWSHTMREGERWRRWDSCLTLEFAEVAGGINFRGEREARLRQRMKHKLIWFEEQFGKVGCVGCGRCVRYCPKKIDVIEVLKGGKSITSS